MTEGDALHEVLSVRTTTEPIPQDKVRNWLLNNDIEVQGAAADLITYPPYWDRVEPQLSALEYQEFLLPYYERCLREDPSGEWSLSRYETAHVIVDWFSAVPKDADVQEQEFLALIKTWLSRLYIESSEEIKDAIICGALEHILEEPRWRPVFKDWSETPELAKAYEQAMEWAVEHER